MDPMFRGVCEKYIDSKLEDDEIEKIKNIVDVLDLSKNVVEDISLGFFIGSVISHFDSNFIENLNDPQKQNEIEKYLDVLWRRSSEIKSKINSSVKQHVESLETTVEIEDGLPEQNAEDPTGTLKASASEIKFRIRSWVDQHIERLKTAVARVRNTEEMTAEKETSSLYHETPEEFELRLEKRFNFGYNSVIRNKPFRQDMGKYTKNKRPRTRTLRLSPLLEEA